MKSKFQNKFFVPDFKFFNLQHIWSFICNNNVKREGNDRNFLFPFFRAYVFFCYLIGYKFLQKAIFLYCQTYSWMLKIVFPKQFLFFIHGSAQAKILLVYGIYYTHALAIYGHIFSSKYRFIVNLLHSLTPFF